MSDQVVIQYDPVQDRLVLRVFSGTQEYKVWLTRRFVQLLWQVLVSIVKSGVKNRWPASHGVDNDLAQLVHAERIAGCDFSNPPRESLLDAQYCNSKNAQVVGERVSVQLISEQEPCLGCIFLSTKLRVYWNNVGKQEQKAVRLDFLPEQGLGMSLNLDDFLPHALTEMIANACKAADWGVNLSFSGEEGAQVVPSAGDAVSSVAEDAQNTVFH